MEKTNMRKLTELTEKLALRDQLLKQFVKYCPAPVAMLDKNRRFLLCSDSWEKRFKQAAIPECTNNCKTVPWYFEDGSLGGELVFEEVQKEAVDERSDT